MFGIFDDIVEGVSDLLLNISPALIRGVMPSAETIKQALATGITIYEISDLTGFSIEILRGIIGEDD